MADPLTTNKFLAQPTHASDVDTWAPPLNTNYGIIDNSFGGTATVAVTSSPVTLASSQYQNVFLRFTGALNANVAITLPAVGSFYTVINDTTNSSAFYLTMLTTAAGGRQIGVPPDTTEILTDGTNVRFRNLPPVGSYWNHSGSSTPAWVDACTVPPYLYCNGTGFSSASYPTLNAVLGSTTLPDFRGRQAVYYNDGTLRITSSVSGVDGNTVKSAGGSQTTTMSSAHFPNVSFPVTDPGHNHTIASNNSLTGSITTAGGPATGGNITAAIITVNSQVTGISVNSGGSGTPFAVIPPAIISGITLIRAA